MITIEPPAWEAMAEHARAAFPRECCGILVGAADGDLRTVTRAIPCRNVFDGDQKDRFAIDPREQLAADRWARAAGLTILGFFHSHPNEASYFSATDLKNSWPWYSNVVISVRNGQVEEARSFIANNDQTAASEEPLEYRAPAASLTENHG